MKTKRWWVAAVLAGGALLSADEAFAIVGRPLTPMSYAGVARRTTRRAVVAESAAAPVVAVPVAPPPGAVAALPAGCVAGTPCAGVVYKPVYQGTTLLYVPGA
jgi:hypothetical protein